MSKYTIKTHIPHGSCDAEYQLKIGRRVIATIESKRDALKLIRALNPVTAMVLVTVDGGNVQSVDIMGRATVTVRDFDQDETPESELTGRDGRHGYVDSVYTSSEQD